MACSIAVPHKYSIPVVEQVILFGIRVKYKIKASLSIFIIIRRAKSSSWPIVHCVKHFLLASAIGPSSSLEVNYSLIQTISIALWVIDCIEWPIETSCIIQDSRVISLEVSGVSKSCFFGRILKIDGDGWSRSQTAHVLIPNDSCVTILTPITSKRCLDYPKILVGFSICSIAHNKHCYVWNYSWASWLIENSPFIIKKILIDCHLSNYRTFIINHR